MWIVLLYVKTVIANKEDNRKKNLIWRQITLSQRLSTPPPPFYPSRSSSPPLSLIRTHTHTHMQCTQITTTVLAISPARTAIHYYNILPLSHTHTHKTRILQPHTHTHTHTHLFELFSSLPLPSILSRDNKNRIIIANLKALKVNQPFFYGSI